MDLKAGYNLIQIKKDNELRTAFRSQYGHYEYTVMPFGLANTPAMFPNMMYENFKDMIDHRVVIYLDNILIYRRSEEDHIVLIKKVLEYLQKHELALLPEKCECHMFKVKFLGYIISENGIEMD